MANELKEMAGAALRRILFPRDAHFVTTKVGDQPYAVKPDGTLGEPVRELPPQWESPVFEVSTLSALVALYKEKLDDLEETAAFHVKDYLNVELVSLQADEFGRRHVYARARHVPDTRFQFVKYYPSPEDFLIAFRSSFLFNEEAVKVTQVCSAVGAGDAVAVSDDGISQEVVVKSGTVTKNAVQLPADGIPLIPWRTFRDANPVVSRFLLRMKGVKDSLPQIALFEIDARWKLDTQAAIANWIQDSAPEAKIVA